MVDIKIYIQLITMLQKKKYSNYNDDDHTNSDDDITMIIKEVKRLSNGAEAKILSDVVLNSHR